MWDSPGVEHFTHSFHRGLYSAFLHGNSTWARVPASLGASWESKNQRKTTFLMSKVPVEQVPDIWCTPHILWLPKAGRFTKNPEWPFRYSYYSPDWGGVLNLIALQEAWSMGIHYLLHANSETADGLGNNPCPWRVHGGTRAIGFGANVDRKMSVFLKGGLGHSFGKGWYPDSTKKK